MFEKNNITWDMKIRWNSNFSIYRFIRRHTIHSWAETVRVAKPAIKTSYKMKVRGSCSKQWLKDVAGGPVVKTPSSQCRGILQARILEWVVISSSRESFQPRDRTPVPGTGRWILYCWAIREAHSEGYSHWKAKCSKMKRFCMLPSGSKDPFYKKMNTHGWFMSMNVWRKPLQYCN